MCVEGHVDVLIFAANLVEEIVDYLVTLFLKDSLHFLLIGAKLWLGVVIARVAKITVIRSIWCPFALLFRLNLLFNEFDQKCGDGVMIKVMHQTGENFALLMDKQIFKDHLFLLVEQLLHNF